MRVFMYKPQFAPLVESGKKKMTIRKYPERVDEVGTELSHRKWEGTPYRSKHIILKEGILHNTVAIEMPEKGKIWLVKDKRYLSDSEIRVIAQLDGFKNTLDFLDFFDKENGFPFKGLCYFWD